MIGKKWSIKNVLKNWFLILSTMAYALMQIRLYIPFIISLIGILAAVIVIAGYIDGVIIDYCRGKSKYIILYSFLNALGVVFANYKVEWNYYESSFQANNGKIEKLICFFDIKADVFNILVKCFFIMASIISFGVIYIFLIYCSGKILSVLKDIRIHSFISNASKQEKIIFSIVFFAQMVISIIFFRSSVAGYAGPCDIIYGTDSAIYGNVMGFLHTDILNIRQPLLEVISAPFIGFTFLFTIVPVKNAWIASTLAQLVQIGLLLLANIILVKLLNLDNVKQRVLVFLLLSVSYSNLEGILIIEKYIFAYFWLIIYIAWNLSENRREGVGSFVTNSLMGSMVTGVFIVPFTVFEQCNFSIKNATEKLARLFFSFVFVLVITFHLGTILSVARSDTFSYAGGVKVSLLGTGGKLLQYFNFIGSCFLAPRAENIIRYGKRTWFLSNVKNLNLVGVIIFCLIVLSIAINFSDKLCRTSGIWIGGSIILFVIGGYGAKDNELAIYLLYFSWAFVVLLIKLISKLHEKVTVLIEIFCLSVCFMFNTIGIINLMDFSCQYYPF